jgi:DNA-binding transcriptional ArsR family regulator
MLDHSEPLSRVLSALADPTRRAIVERLSEGERPVSALAQPLSMSLAAVLQHVQALEACGVISTQKQGRVRTCRIEPHAFTLLDHWLSQRRKAWHQQFDRLAAVLTAQDRDTSTTARKGKKS